MVLETVELLVEAGVDVNAVGHVQNRGVREASTALEAAIALEYDSVTEFLVGKGAIAAAEPGSSR